MANHYMQAPDGQIIRTDSPRIWNEWKKLPKAEGARLYREQCIAQCHEYLKPGDTVYCVLRHVSSSGMSRRISFFAVVDSSLVCLDRWIIGAGIGSEPRNDNPGVSVGGCGMDMGFAIVYELGAAMWPNGTPKPHGKRNGEDDTAGGYALKHRWV